VASSATHQKQRNDCTPRLQIFKHSSKNSFKLFLMEPKKQYQSVHLKNAAFYLSAGFILAGSFPHQKFPGDRISKP